ncbi:MAG: substrate-binding domain-containing protein [Magnetococcales bacterium]|nr:substrate-binding domain-containing protein [Magnetococcales bacterium]
MEYRLIRLLLIAFVSTMAPSSAQAGDSVVIRGSHALYWTLTPHMDAINQATGLDVDFAVAGGCGDGAKATAAGHIGAICCPFDDLELATLGGGVMSPLALEPLMIVVNLKNPVTDLTLAQVRGLLSGQMTNWSQVGGPDKNVAVVLRPHCPHRPQHWKMILPQNQWREKKITVNSTVKMIDAVAAIPGAIGHLGTVLLDPQKMKPILIDGISPLDPEALAKGYPFYRPLALMTQGEPGENEGKLITYLRSEAAKPFFLEQHLIPSSKLTP